MKKSFRSRSLFSSSSSFSSSKFFILSILMTSLYSTGAQAQSGLSVQPGSGPSRFDQTNPQQQNQSCNEKLKFYESIDLNRAAIIQALQSTTSQTKYVAIAKIKTDRSDLKRAAATLDVIDLKTGKVISFNSLKTGPSTKHPRYDEFEKKNFGSDPLQRYNPDLTGLGIRRAAEKHPENMIALDAWSGLLKAELKANNQHPDSQPTPNPDYIVACDKVDRTLKNKELNLRGPGQLMCLDQEEFKQFEKMMKAHQGSVFMTFPANNKKYFEERKKLMSEDKACGVLSQFTLETLRKSNSAAGAAEQSSGQQ